MAETASTMLPLGSKAPDFTLLDTRTNQNVSLANAKSNQATVIMFICNHCPYVLHVLPKLVAVARDYQAKGCAFIAISSNDATQYPQDGPEKMREHAKQYGFSFPYLYDESQAVARAYHAACTPDFYVFDKNLACVYRGRFDESTPRSGKPVTGHELTQALDQLLAGKPINPQQFPSLGCNIKWKS